MAVKYLIFLVLKNLINAQNTCDSSTSLSCYIKEQTVSSSTPFNLSNRNSSFPVTYLLILDTKMQKISTTLFPNYPNISFFSIAYNELQEIAPESFTNCMNLGSVMIRSGLLTKIPSGTFKACSNLMSLQITNHSISTIDLNAFEGLKNLNSLYLNNNLMSSLNPNFLVNLPKLSLIDLSSNKLTIVDSTLFKQNPLISAVYLEDNYLTSVPSDLFATQTKVSTLKMSNNKLTSFQSLGVIYLDLMNNKLTSFNFTNGGDDTLHLAHNFIKKLNCPNIEALSVRRLYIQNNSLTNFLCIRDMKNLTDMNITTNNVRPTQKALLKLKNLRSFSIFNQQKYPKLIAKAFMNMTSLSSLYVDNFQSYQSVKKFIPSLYLLGLTTKLWTCNRTQQVANMLATQKVRIIYNNYNDRYICNITQPVS